MEVFASCFAFPLRTDYGIVPCSSRFAIEDISANSGRDRARSTIYPAACRAGACSSSSFRPGSTTSQVRAPRPHNAAATRKGNRPPELRRQERR
jgi:hypothetical protein